MKKFLLFFSVIFSYLIFSAADCNKNNPTPTIPKELYFVDDLKGWKYEGYYEISNSFYSTSRVILQKVYPHPKGQISVFHSFIDIIVNDPDYNEYADMYRSILNTDGTYKTVKMPSDRPDLYFTYKVSKLIFPSLSIKVLGLGDYDYEVFGQKANIGHVAPGMENYFHQFKGMAATHSYLRVKSLGQEVRLSNLYAWNPCYYLGAGFKNDEIYVISHQTDSNFFLVSRVTPQLISDEYSDTKQAYDYNTIFYNRISEFIPGYQYPGKQEFPITYYNYGNDFLFALFSKEKMYIFKFDMFRLKFELISTYNIPQSETYDILKHKFQWVDEKYNTLIFVERTTDGPIIKKLENGTTTQIDPPKFNSKWGVKFRHIDARYDEGKLWLSYAGYLFSKEIK